MAQRAAAGGDLRSDADDGVGPHLSRQIQQTSVQIPTCAACAASAVYPRDELAYDANVSRSYLSQLESAFYASLKIVARLAEALDVELAELLRPLMHRARRGR